MLQVFQSEDRTLISDLDLIRDNWNKDKTKILYIQIYSSIKSLITPQILLITARKDPTQDSQDSQR